VPAARGFLYQGPSLRLADPLRSAKAKSSPHFSTLFFRVVRRVDIIVGVVNHLEQKMHTEISLKYGYKKRIQRSRELQSISKIRT
jgi:hypothetical protein